jgi:hypothetical protein
MTRIRFAVVAGAVVVLVGAAVALAAVPKRLNGTVGPGFTITLKSSTGKVVTRLTPGRYAFKVKDASPIHNFTLKGPGLVNKVVTATGFTGTKTAIVTLKRGTYRFYCTIHPDLMSKTFKVG